ncbi:hypothetical protein [Aeoliella mucimassa]|uniref:Uncharacterized protein n=1 Tax=Aeoliella mucimassa TaxID=2527972 RepID=A0A518ARG9_9BACT|nr:hypothetical protein [Aeoliella mucimassa]QDU57314.1 hypothetical protein Pan181_35290 [Aeoliella mucimassa]
MPLWIRRLLIGLAALGLLLAVFVSWFAWKTLGPHTAPIVSPTTTVVTSPLAEDGLPDYSQYLLLQSAEGVTPENNAAIPLLQATWWADFDSAQQTLVCQQLGIEPPSHRGLEQPMLRARLIEQIASWRLKHLSEKPEYEGSDALHFETDLEHWCRDHLVPAMFSTPWTKEDAEPLARWLEDYQSCFTLLEQAAARDQYFMPCPDLLGNQPVRLLEVTTPDLKIYRVARQCLSLRAQLRIGSGDLEGAWRDSQTLYRLAALDLTPSIMHWLVAISSESMANDIVRRILDAPALSPALAAEIAEFYASRSTNSKLRAATDGFSRLELVTEVMSHARSRDSEQVDPQGSDDDFKALVENANMSHLAIDWNIVLQTANAEIDELVALFDQKEPGELPAAVDAWLGNIASETRDMVLPPKSISIQFDKQSRSEHLGYLLCEMYFSGYSSLVSSDLRNTCERTLVETAVAVKRYELSKGTLPPDLDALVPGYLPSAPVDPFGQAMVYRVTDDGFLLYSKGEDRVDQQGSNSVYKLYQGRPMPETDWDPQADLAQLGPPAVDMAEKFGVLKTPGQLQSHCDDLPLRFPIYPRELPEFTPPD